MNLQMYEGTGSPAAARTSRRRPWPDATASRRAGSLHDNRCLGSRRFFPASAHADFCPDPRQRCLPPPEPDLGDPSAIDRGSPGKLRRTDGFGGSCIDRAGSRRPRPAAAPTAARRPPPLSPSLGALVSRCRPGSSAPDAGRSHTTRSAPAPRSMSLYSLFRSCFYYVVPRCSLPVNQPHVVVNKSLEQRGTHPQFALWKLCGARAGNLSKPGSPGHAAAPLRRLGERPLGSDQTAFRRTSYAAVGAGATKERHRASRTTLKATGCF